MQKQHIFFLCQLAQAFWKFYIFNLFSKTTGSQESSEITNAEFVTQYTKTECKISLTNTKIAMRLEEYEEVFI